MANALHRAATQLVRGVASKNKRRYQDAEFDLDLTYVTANLIAMGFPSSGIEALFRNPLTEVVAFLEQSHRGHYKVYNLCGEREALQSGVFPIVEMFPFADHQPCPLDMLPKFCQSVKKHLDEHPKNVVVVHCKAGKGRTGLMLSAFLLHSGMCGTAEEALEVFGQGRTYDGRGVTVPSQIRYVHYYEQLLRDGGRVPRRIYQVLSLRLISIPDFSRGFQRRGCRPTFVIRRWSSAGGSFPRMVTVYDHLQHTGSANFVEQDEEEVELDCSGSKGSIGPLVEGDIQIALVNARNNIGRCNEEMCRFWFHTSYVETSMVGEVLELDKSNIDEACKDAAGHFQEDFKIELRLRRAADESGPVSELQMETREQHSGRSQSTCLLPMVSHRMRPFRFYTCCDSSDLSDEWSEDSRTFESPSSLVGDAM